MGTWILNARVCKEGDGPLQPCNVLVENGVIVRISGGKPDSGELAGHEQIDAAGRLLSAGLIDMHVHLREPGFEYKETIETGTRAAARGGFTTVACMPNTRPVIDDTETLRHVLDKAAQAGNARVLSYACITVNELGRELTDFEALRQAGAIGFTDDGVGVQDAAMMKAAMRKAASLGLPIVAHCEDNALAGSGFVTEGAFARKHGLTGIPNESESVHVGRDILLAETTGVHYHVCHVSTAQSVRLIRQAKAEGIRVTTEVCPHHLLLSDEDIPGLDGNWKMNPPLRSPKDVEAVLTALEDGTIDMLVTDHAPHGEEEKAAGMDKAPFGIVGLETAFPLLYTRFVKTGRWTLRFLLERLTEKPADVFGLNAGRLQEGAPADLTLIDLELEQEVRPEQFASKGRNTPFAGWRLAGWPVWTMVAGRTVFSTIK